MEVNILFEDDFLLVVDKPAGLLVYNPDRQEKEETLVDVLASKLNFKKTTERSGIVHRLDRDTSGLLVVAKDEETQTSLQNDFKDRKVKKEYTALVWGEVKPEKGEIHIPLGRGSKDRLRVVPNEKGRDSVTRYAVKKYFKKSNMSLLEVDLLTGRTHQIRVHFSSIGHPVVGDKKYSKQKVKLQRQFLHAVELSFVHPVTKKLLVFKSDLPSDLNSFLEELA